MRKLKIILSPLIFLMTFACVNDEQDVIVQDENLNKFLNSSFYSSLNDQGYEIDEDMIKYEKIENGIGYVAPINAFPSTMRIASTHAELVTLTDDDSSEDLRSFILAYENIPSEDYSGDITIYDYNSTGESMSFEFENGQLINDFGSSERALNNMGCSFRRTLACVGYRIEAMNAAEAVWFFAGFGLNFAGEVASCWVDGCPYE